MRGSEGGSWKSALLKVTRWLPTLPQARFLWELRPAMGAAYQTRNVQKAF